MQYWTWGELKEKLENEHDIQEEPDLLADGELVGYVNDAIDACEKHFVKLPDYFLANTTITLVAGQSDYDLPEDMYATKIRNLWHNEDEYSVRFLKNLSHKKLLEGMTGVPFRFIILNNSGDTPKLRLIPTPSSGDAGNTLDLDYTRGATRLTGDESEEIDIPEAMGFIVKFVDVKMKEKEKLYGEPLQRAIDARDDEEELLIEALAQRIDDEDASVIEVDTTLYDEHM